METSLYGYSLDDFREEAKDLLGRAEEALSEMQKSPQDMGKVNALFRVIHSLKGSAAYTGLADVNAFAHLYEGFLGDLRNNKYKVNQDVMNILIRARDYLDDLIFQPEATEVLKVDEAAGDPMQQLAAVLKTRNLSPLTKEGGEAPQEQKKISLSAQDPTKMDQNDVIKVTVMNTLKELYSCLKEASPDRELVAKLLAKLEDAALWAFGDESVVAMKPFDEMKRLASGDLGPKELSELRKGFNSMAAAFKRELAGLDEPMKEKAEAREETGITDEVKRKVEERAEVRGADNKTKMAADEARGASSTLRVRSEDIESLIYTIGELVGLDPKDYESLQAHALQLRMVPVGELFSRFKKVVRDLSEELGKGIDLVISGESVKFDKVIADRLNEPILHMVRNAASHGLESIEDRRRAGKRPHGLIRLSASQEGGQIVIEVSDDGRGISLEKVMKRGVEMGLIKAEEEKSISEEALIDLIFTPGFSTMEGADKVSGRGVGMDVVRDVVTSLQGTVTIDTRKGAGTTFRLQLPLTLAIIKGMVFEGRGTKIALPAAFVDRVFNMTEEELRARSFTDKGRLYLDLMNEGEVLPLARLSQFFRTEDLTETRCVVLIKAGMGQKAALVVDSALGRQPLMVKPLDRFAGNRYFSSASVAGNEVVLILNTPSLMAA